MSKVESTTIAALVNSLEYEYLRVPNSTVTLAVAMLPLPNGTRFSVGIGEAACVDPKIFCEEMGKEIARENAFKQALNKLWELEGYKLATA